MRPRAQLVGISSASAFYGVGPISDGSFKSGLIKAEGLEVVTEKGPQHVVFESKTDSSELTIQAAEGKEAKLVLAGNEAVERFSMVSTGTDYFAIRQAGEDRIKIAAQARPKVATTATHTHASWPLQAKHS